MHETSGRAKEEEFLSQDGQMCDRCAIDVACAEQNDALTTYKVH